jgi:micrococcal nuclease
MVRKPLAIIASALAASGTFWYLVSTNGVKIPVPSYRAMRVIDGDTFETKERQIVRITGINAPELGNCDGPEAKITLEKLILNRNLYLKVIFRDGFRLVSFVYNEDGSVSEQMLKAGMAYYLSKDVSHPELKRAGDAAREARLGIYSPKCTQETNPDSKACVIKGNLRDPGGKDKTYHFPGCGQYTQTLIELYKGDQWFCTETEAKKAGFTKGADCFEKTWN